MTSVTAEIVSVAAASRSEKPLIESLSQFYIYDFSEMEPPESERFDFDDSGGLGSIPHIDDYWEREGFHPLLIRVRERTAGFILLNTHSHRGGEVQRNVGEFFVARKYRRRGVAAAAVWQMLALYPGRWEVAVTERNTVAKAFWPKAIKAAPNVSELVRVEGDGEHWRGPIWSFLAR